MDTSYRSLPSLNAVFLIMRSALCRTNLLGWIGLDIVPDLSDLSQAQDQTVLRMAADLPEDEGATGTALHWTAASDDFIWTTSTWTVCCLRVRRVAVFIVSVRITSVWRFPFPLVSLSLHSLSFCVDIVLETLAGLEMYQKMKVKLWKECGLSLQLAMLCNYSTSPLSSSLTASNATIQSTPSSVLVRRAQTAKCSAGSCWANGSTSRSCHTMHPIILLFSHLCSANERALVLVLRLLLTCRVPWSTAGFLQRWVPIYYSLCAGQFIIERGRWRWLVSPSCTASRSVTSITNSGHSRDR